MHWRRSLHSGLHGENGCHHASRETPDPESSPFGCSDEGRCTMDWKGKKGLYPRFEREGWSREFTFRMQWRRSLHSGLNGENGCHHYSRETPDLESSPSRDAWSWEFTFWMHWRRSLHSGLNGENGSHIASRETPDPESSPSGCSDEGRCTQYWTGIRQSHRFERDAWSLEFTFRMHWRRSLHSVLNGKNGCHHASRETPDPESSPSGCSDVGRCTSDWTGKTAVTTLRERFLIPRVHLLDAMTKVVALWTKREKWLSTYFERDAWSREFTFWMQWRRSLPAGLNGKNGCHIAWRETPDL